MHSWNGCVWCHVLDGLLKQGVFRHVGPLGIVCWGRWPCGHRYRKVGGPVEPEVTARWVGEKIFVIACSCFLLFARNEAGDAGFYDGVESDLGFDAFADFADGVFGEGGDVEVFLDAGGGFGGGEEGGSALDGPGEEDLSGSFADSGGDGCDDGIFEQAGHAAVAQRAAKACSTMPCFCKSREDPTRADTDAIRHERPRA